MIKMKNVFNGLEAKIPSGAVESYERLGFCKITAEEVPAMIQEDEDYVQEEVVEPTDEDKCKLLEEKPIGTWTKAEVKFYAIYNNISTETAKKLSDAKKIISDWIAQNK